MILFNRYSNVHVSIELTVAASMFAKSKSNFTKFVFDGVDLIRYAVVLSVVPLNP